MDEGFACVSGDTQPNSDEPKRRGSSNGEVMLGGDGWALEAGRRTHGQASLDINDYGAGGG